MSTLKVFLLFIVAVMVSVVAFAQAPDWLWAKSVGGGTGVESGWSISHDSSGNCYVTGNFEATVNMGYQSFTSFGGTDIFIAKLDVNGNWLWAKQTGGGDNDLSYSISTDSSGNCYVTGIFIGTVNFGFTSLTSSGGPYTDVFIAKLDSAGNWLWAKRAGGTYYDYSYGISCDSSGNSYVTGSFRGTAEFGSTVLTNNGSTDVFIAKLDTNGNWLWAIRSSGNGDNAGTGISTNNSGYLYVTGVFYGTAYFGSTALTSYGDEDVFVAKLDTNGNWLWARSGGGEYYDYGFGISTDSSGNSFLSGTIHSATATFGSFTLTNYGYYDPFIVKLDTNGNWLWAKHAGGTGFDGGYGISTTSNGNCYVTGYFNNTASFGSISLTSNGYSDIFIAMLDTNGNWLWAKRVGGTGYSESGYGISVDSSGNSYVTGFFDGTADFGATSLTCSGNQDIFISKLSTNGNWLWAKSIGGYGFDRGYSISTDSSGNSYVTGYFQYTASFGTTTLTSYGNRDIFVAKMDPNGNWLWAKCIISLGGTNGGMGYGISTDSSGNSYVTGYFNGYTYFGSTMLTSSGRSDIFIAKLSTDGTWAWAKRAGGVYNDVGYGISTDNSGNCYVTGSFLGTADFGSTSLISSEDPDAAEIFVAKLDINGNWLWAKRAGGNDTDISYAISSDYNGNCYITGWFRATASFGSISLSSSGGNYPDIFVAKLDTNGNWLWANRAGGTTFYSDMGYGISTDGSGNCYVTGLFFGTASFGTTSLSNSDSYNSDIFVAKLSANGNWLWAQSAGGNDSDIGYGISTDSSGNSYITGNFRASASFGAYSLTAVGHGDVYIAKLDTNGNWLWAKSAVGTPYLSNSGQGISTDNNGNCYITGYFCNTTNFDTSVLTSLGDWEDIFVAKIRTAIPIPKAPENLEITVNGADTHLTWNPVIMSIDNQPLIVDAYYVYESCSDAIDGAYVFIGMTTMNSMTLYNEPPGPNRKFYWVTAIKF